jgi:hypothetical protein
MTYATDVRLSRGPVVGLWGRIAAAFVRGYEAMIAAQERRAKIMVEEYLNGRRPYI